MREIIFRGWDGENILPPQDISTPSKHWTWLGKIDCLHEQYTGLVDKNGVMIFEGDVVFAGYGEYYQSTHEYSTTITVDMSNYDALNALCNANVVEVIGNIHEEEKK